jgi:hypothetical protein
MSLIAVQGGATGTGTVTLLAPITNTDRTLTLPDATGTVVSTGSTAVVSQAMLAAGVAGNGPAFSAYQSSGQSITSSTYTKVSFQTEEFDTNNNFDSTTNYRFTPTISGYYQINAAILPSTTTTNTACSIYKNGTAYKTVSIPASNSSAIVSAVVYFNGSTDYVEIYGYLTGVTPAIQNGSSFTWFNGAMVRSA